MQKALLLLSFLNLLLCRDHALAVPIDLNPVEKLWEWRVQAQIASGGFVFSEDGSAFAVVNATRIGPEYESFLIKFTPNGTLDHSFAEDGYLPLKTTVKDANTRFLEPVIRDGYVFVGSYRNRVFASAKKCRTYLISVDFQGNPNPDFGKNGTSILEAEDCNFVFPTLPVSAGGENWITVTLKGYLGKNPYLMESILLDRNGNRMNEVKLFERGRLQALPDLVSAGEKKYYSASIETGEGSETKVTTIISRIGKDGKLDKTFGKDGYFTLPLSNPAMYLGERGLYIVLEQDGRSAIVLLDDSGKVVDTVATFPGEPTTYREFVVNREGVYVLQPNGQSGLKLRRFVDGKLDPGFHENGTLIIPQLFSLRAFDLEFVGDDLWIYSNLLGSLGIGLYRVCRNCR